MAESTGTLTPQPVPQALPTTSWRERFRGTNLRSFALFAALLLLWLFAAYTTKNEEGVYVFLLPRNLSNLTTQIAINAILAIGMTLVIIIAQIDLSVGAGVAMLAVLVAKLQVQLHWDPLLAVIATLIAGAVMGLWQGFWVAYMRIPSFVVTLSGFYAFRSIALILSDGRSISGMTKSFKFIGTDYIPNDALVAAAPWLTVSSVMLILAFVAYVGYYLLDRRNKARHGFISGSALLAVAQIIGVVIIFLALAYIFSYQGIPNQVAILALVALLGVFITTQTRFGQYCYAVGGNKEAARRSGVQVNQITLRVFVFMGVLTAVGAMVLAAWIGNAQPNLGEFYELDAITAVVIGGTSLFGGEGTILGSLLGALLLGTIGNLQNLLNISPFFQGLIRGAILLAAVTVDIVSKRGRT
jgi:D-xylose transport system permease protein